MRNGEPLDYRGEEPPGRYTWRTVVGIILLIAGFPFAGCYGYVFVGMSVLGLLDPDPQPREHWNDGPWPFFLLAVGGVAAVTAGFWLIRSRRMKPTPLPKPESKYIDAW